MHIKNTFKILTHAFHFLWVLLVYIMLISVIVVGLSLAVFTPVANAITQLDLGPALSEAATQIMSGENFATGMGSMITIVQSVIDVLTNPKDFGLNYISIVFVVGVLGRFLLALYEVPLAALIEGQMSINSNLRFIPQFFRNIGKSSKAALARIMMTIPYDAVCLVLIGLVSNLFGMGIFFLAPLLMMLILVVFSAFKSTMLCYWYPALVSDENRIFKSLGQSMKRSIKNIGKLFTVMFTVWICILSINIFFALFSFGAGLIITIPISVLFLAILRAVFYYHATGKRYYVSDETVVTPSGVKSGEPEANVTDSAE